MKTKIEEEAFRRYPDEHPGTKGMIDSSRRKYFIEGAKWMEEYLSSKVQQCTRRGSLS